MSLTSAGESSTIRILVKTDEPLPCDIPIEVLQLRSQAGDMRLESNKRVKLFIFNDLEQSRAVLAGLR
jgi:hypothetical protein